MKLKRLVICTLVCASVFSVSLCLNTNNVLASQISEIEDNGTTTQATGIPLNTEVGGTLSNSKDKDYFRFELEQDSVVSLTYNYSDGVPNMRMGLFDAQNKNIIDLVYDSDKVVLPSDSNRYNLPAGSYFVLVSDYYGGNKNMGDYTITVNAQECEGNREVEYNESMNTATEVELNTEIIGNLSNSSDKDYYKFEIPGNGSITLEYNYEAGKSDMRMTLFDIDGSDRQWVYDSENIVMPTRTNTFRVPEGTYYICISDYYGGSKNNADYTININYDNESGKDYEIEYNGTITLSNELSLDRKIIGNLYDSKDKDYYTFSISNTKNITLIYDYQSGTPNMRISILDQNSKEISSTTFDSQNDSFPYKIPLNNIAAGNYYIIVSDYYGGAKNNADYTLTVSQNGGGSGEVAVTKPSATSIQSLKSNAKTKATLTYRQVNNATGYQIMYSPYKNFASASYTTTGQTKVTLSKLKSKKTYYVKVRAYVKQNGKTVYGNYSSPKTVKVK